MLPGAEVLTNDYEFGTAVAMGDGVAFVAAPNARCCHVSSSGASQNNGNGAVYVYERDASGSWSRTQTLQQIHLGNNGKFGRSLDTDGDGSSSGATGPTVRRVSSATGDALYQRGTAESGPRQSLTPPAGVLSQGDEYGLTVRIDGEVVDLSREAGDGQRQQHRVCLCVAQERQQLGLPGADRARRSWRHQLGRCGVAGDRVFVAEESQLRLERHGLRQRQPGPTGCARASWRWHLGRP